MHLNYSSIKFDAYGRPEPPTLLLETLDEEPIGILSATSDLSLSVKFAEVSELKFRIAAEDGGSPTPFYDRLTGYKLIRTEQYGVFVINSPEESGDGIQAYKDITAYSREKLLESKKFYLEEGTFNFWNPASPSDTIIGRALELMPGWGVGYVSPSLIGKYRTFDSYDNYLLPFLYSEITKKYRCVVVFDTYEMTFSVYDADETRPMMPVYLDFDNLVKELNVKELSDELITAMRPYGSDGLDIRSVNPTGTNWIYNIDHFIANGDIPHSLAQRWQEWEAQIVANREYYRGLSGLQASVTASILAEQAKLTDLNGELENLTNQQSITIQALAQEVTADGKQQQQQLLDQINSNISNKKQEIAAQESRINELKKKIDPDVPDSYAAQIAAVVKRLSFSAYFSESEQKSLQPYFIEQDITEETFVVPEISSSANGTTYSLNNNQIRITGASVVKIDLTTQFGKTVYTLSGGKVAISGDLSIAADIVRGTMEAQNGDYVLSIYAGDLKAGDTTAQSGMITLSGRFSGMTDDIKAVTENEITSYEGTMISFSTASSSLFLTANAGDYQKYSVQMELLEYAEDVLNDVATPTYEFDLDTSNFIFAQEFTKFRDQLRLGNALYLRLHNGEVISPVLIEAELNFEDIEKLNLVFSNRFKRYDGVSTLKDMIQNSYTTSRDFDASKYIYNQSVGAVSAVTEFMQGSLDAAVNTIYGAKNQSVIIDGAGIHVGGESECQIRIVNSMIALTNDNWKTAKIGIGLFSSPEVGSYFGVNAEVIGGKLICGNNLVIENQNDQGVMQFKVDSSGAWLSNSTFVLQKNGGGKLLIDPNYGIVAGNGSLFTTQGTTVTPAFANGSGGITTDSDGMPTNANFFLDLRNGNAYFRGKISATSGSIGGFTVESTNLHGGSGSTYVGLNGSGSGTNSAYAIWAGNSTPSSAPFYVKKNGDLYAKNGTFKGTVQGGQFKDSAGNSMMNGRYEFKADYLNLNGINVGNGNFKVDSSGNVSVRGSITMAAGSSINWATVSETNASYSSAYKRADSAYSAASSASQKADSAYNEAQYAYDLAWENRVTDENIFNILTDGGTRFGIFSDSTSGRLYINANYIRSGTIDADIVTLGTDDGGFCCATGHDGEYRTYGAMMYGGSGPYGGVYAFVSNSGVRLSAGSDYIYVASGGPHASREISVDSDSRFKHDIQYDIDKYAGMIRKLRAVSYCLNADTVPLRHFGFIAQEVEQVIEECGINPDGLSVLDKSVREYDGKVDQYYGIRYGELIPVCVHMIQDLLTRIERLEEKEIDVERIAE